MIPDDNAKQDCHTDTIRCLLVLPPERVFSGSADGTVKLWNYRTGEKVGDKIGEVERESGIFLYSHIIARRVATTC